MKTDLTEIIVILDRSGSMSSIWADSLGGFNSFMNSQKTLPGEAKVTFALFDDKYEMPYDNVDIKDIPKLTDKKYLPRGSTSLLDAIGKTLNSVGERLSNTSEEDRPEKVMVLVITDGCENSSREYTREQIKEMIEHQTNVYGWNFTYIGANQDSFTEGQAMGFSNAMNYSADSVGVTSMYCSVNTLTREYRSK